MNFVHQTLSLGLLGLLLPLGGPDCVSHITVGGGTDRGKCVGGKEHLLTPLLILEPKEEVCFSVLLGYSQSFREALGDSVQESWKLGRTKRAAIITDQTTGATGRLEVTRTQPEPGPAMLGHSF